MEWLQSKKRAIPAPVKISSRQIFITGGYGQGSVMLTLTSTGTKVHIKENFRINKIGCQIHTQFYLATTFMEISMKMTI